MKHPFLRATLFLLLILMSAHLRAQNFQRSIPFDEGWRFFLGGVERGEYPTLDDRGWREVRLPHDWSIEDLPGRRSPFDSNAVSQVSGGFTTGGTGWYRKTFSLPPSSKDQKVLIQFDGVYMNADVWLNGHLLGNHPYGYTSFFFDLTPYLNYGAPNILAVQVKNEGQTSRWYSGSGINRHVWLQLLHRVHVAPWGVAIATTEVGKDEAAVKVTTRIEGASSGYTLVTEVLSPQGKSMARVSNVLHGDSLVAQQLPLVQPELWSPEHPHLYTLVTRLLKGTDLEDEVSSPFGIRTLTLDRNRGLLLNGLPIKLKGACFHNDNGPLGSRAFDRAEERRVELLKASGFNAIRCSHNPPAPAFLDACDRLGMLVIDETFDMWEQGKNPYDYHLYFKEWWQRDVKSMVVRDRNHPSVIMWSIGNEIPGKERPEVVATGRAIRDYVRSLDTTRPITAAVNDIREDKDPYFSLLDVAGYNYGVQAYATDHVRHPERIMMATESYPLEAFDYWMAVEDHPYLIGDFVWTGFDYIGEASIGWRGYYQEKNFFPWNLAYCGDIDICGWKRPQSYYRDALWKPNQLSIFVTPPQPSFELNPHIETWSKWNWNDVVADWNWKGHEGQPMDVTVYSSCEEVELFLNGKSLGRKPTNRSSKFIAVWKVPYQQGTLKAVGYRGKKQVNTTALWSAGQPTHLNLHADRMEIKANGQDLSYVQVELLDDKGIKNPKADQLVKFEIEGPGTIVGVGNANPMSLESYQQPQRKAWQGRCLVVIQSKKQSGTIILRATAEGLTPATLVISSK